MAGTLLPMQGAWVLSLVRELGSPMPQGAAKNLEKKNQSQKSYDGSSIKLHDGSMICEQRSA